MIRELRSQCDLLLVPMAFGDNFRDNMMVSFPSKLTDYTATGLPLLIYGPSYCSAVSWARLDSNIAEIVDRPEPDAILQALLKLRAEPDQRGLLAERSSAAGRRDFDASAVRDVFYSAIIPPSMRTADTF